MADFEQLMGLGPLIMKRLQDEIEGLRGGMSQDLGRRRQAADTAFGALEEAGRAPQPEAGPAEGIQQLFGDVGSIISRRPEFGQRSREDIQQRVAGLRDQRMQNLQILRDKYHAAAQQLDKVDPIKALEYNEKVERVSKLLEQGMEMEKVKYTQDQESKRNTERVQGGITEANIRADADRYGAELAHDSRLLNALSGAGNKAATTKVERAELLDALRKQFVVKGKLKSPNLYRAGLLDLPPYEGQSEEQWIREMQEGFRTAKGGGKLDRRDLEEIVRNRARWFPSAPSVPGETSTTAPGTGAANLRAPAVETPGTPPDAALELIDEATELIETELKATGPLAATRRQQAQARLDKIEAILNSRFNLSIRQTRGLSMPETVVR